MALATALRGRSVNRFHAVAAVQLALAAAAWLLLRRGRPWSTRLASLSATAALLPLVLLAIVWPSIHTLLLLVALPGVVAILATIVWPGWLAPVRAAVGKDPVLPRLSARLQAEDGRRQLSRKVLRGWGVAALLLGLGSTVLQAEWDRCRPCFSIELVIPDGYRGEVDLVEGGAAGVVLDGEALIIRVPVTGVVTIRGQLPSCFTSISAREQSGAVRPSRLDGWSSSSAGHRIHFRVE